MNNEGIGESTLPILSRLCKVEHLQKSHGSQQSGRCKVGHNNSNTRDGDGDKNLPEKGITLVDWKTRHTKYFRCKKYRHYKPKCRMKLQNEQVE